MKSSGVHYNVQRHDGEEWVVIGGVNNITSLEAATRVFNEAAKKYPRVRLLMTTWSYCVDIINGEGETDEEPIQLEMVFI